MDKEITIKQNLLLLLLFGSAAFFLVYFTLPNRMVLQNRLTFVQSSSHSIAPINTGLHDTFTINR